MSEQTILRGILINAYTRSITEVAIPTGTDPIYKELSKDATNPVDCFTCVDIAEDPDGMIQTLFVDDNGMFMQTQFFKISNHSTPLAGNALLLGTDMENGESISTSMSIDEVRKHVEFLSRIQVLAGCGERW